ncbi:MAG: alpha/beta fold hydrolase [Bacteroidota bacterium]
MSSLYYREKGSGQPVILLHGFPMNQEVWNSFANKLSTSCHVLTPDLPGFGKSPLFKGHFTIDDVGNSVIGWLKKKELSNVTLIGHSLGGYVALAIASQKPALIKRLGLFHSTAAPDNEEKKQSRNKVLEFIDKQGVQAFTSNFIAPLFADQNHSAINIVRDIAVQATAEAVKGYTQAMRDRADRTSLLKEFPRPILWIAGEKDGGIPVDSIRKQAALCQSAELHILPNVAHMGMFENEELTLSIVKSFSSAG